MTEIDFSNSNPRKLLSLLTNIRSEDKLSKIERKLLELKKSRKFDTTEIEKIEQRIKKIRGL